LGDSRKAGLLSLSPQAGAPPAECSADFPAARGLPPGRVTHRHAISLWFFAEVAPLGPENRSDRLSFCAADAGILGTSSRPPGGARKHHQGAGPGLVRVARLRPHGQRAAGALESDGAFRFTHGPGIYARGRLSRVAAA